MNIEWEEVLTLLPVFGNRLLVEGIGGSGKTTLLQWTAVEALCTGSSHADRALRASMSSDRLESLLMKLPAHIRDFPARFARELGHWSEKGVFSGIPWFDRVPFFVRLREHADGKLPSPEELPRLISTTALGTSEGWVRQVIAEKRAIFLIDGIDEVRGEVRDNLARDIEAYLRDYEGCPLIATSRPAAVQEERWTRLFGPFRLLVERMAKPDVEQFVRHWYRAYGIVRKEQRDERAVERLISQIEAREGLAGLMDTPLLAASICFLNKDRRDELPRSAPELYGQLCRQLVHQLDEDRLHKDGYAALVPALKDLEYDQKIYLLAKLAQRMVENGESVLSEEEAKGEVQEGLTRLGRGSGRNEGEVLHALQERSGLLRGSSPTMVEFAHNNLRGWLAARGFSEIGQWALPVERAFDLGDYDLPVLAAAQARSERYRGQLIDKCLKVAESDKDVARIAKIMALRCGQAGAVDMACRRKVERLLEEVLPPTNAQEAAWLSELGERIVGRLAAQAGRDAGVNAACVRCLRLIGGARATEVLPGYLNHQDEQVLGELAQAVPPLSIPRVREWVTRPRLSELFEWPPFPASHYITAADLLCADEDFQRSDRLRLRDANIANAGFVKKYGKLRKLDLFGTRVFEVEPLSQAIGLQSLNLSFTPVSDVSPLAGLTALHDLVLIGTQVSDISLLAGLTGLQSLDLSRTQVSDISPLAGLTALQELDVSFTKIEDISPLAGLTALQRLDLSFTKIEDISPLAGLTGLQSLFLTGTKVSDLAPLAGLTALQILDLSGTEVSDLAPLAGLTTLQFLDLSGTEVSDLAPLAGLTALRRLYFKDTPVIDLTPLAGLELEDLEAEIEDEERRRSRPA